MAGVETTLYGYSYLFITLSFTLDNFLKVSVLITIFLSSTEPIVYEQMSVTLKIGHAAEKQSEERLLFIFGDSISRYRP